MSYDRFNRKELYDKKINIDLDSTNFLNVCILQRHAWLYDRKLYEEAKDAVKKITDQIKGPPSERLIHEDSFYIFKELFHIISKFGPDGALEYKYFTPYTHPKVCEKVAKLVFSEKNLELLKIIQSFSQKYGGYDALSLTTFEKIEPIICGLINNHFYCKKILEDTNESQEVGYYINCTTPVCHHQSTIEEKYPPFPIDEIEENLYILIPTDSIKFNRHEPNSYHLNVEKLCYNLVQTIEVYMKMRYGSKAMGFFDMLKVFKIPIDTPIIAKLKKKYEPKSKKNIKLPTDYIFKFCGIKVWDFINRESKTKNEALDALEKWFGKEYKELKYELDPEKFQRNFEKIADKIDNKELE